ncbi:MAG: hypothetical protein ACOYJG_00715 [Prevotella sp.]
MQSLNFRIYGSERSNVYLCVLTSGNRFGGTWHPDGWHLAADGLAPVSNQQ